MWWRVSIHRAKAFYIFHQETHKLGTMRLSNVSQEIYRGLTWEGGWKWILAWKDWWMTWTNLLMVWSIVGCHVAPAQPIIRHFILTLYNMYTSGRFVDQWHKSTYQKDSFCFMTTHFQNFSTLCFIQTNRYKHDTVFSM